MRLIDISNTLDESTPVFPGDHKTTLSIYKTIEKDHFNAYLLQSGLHTGTHIDIPMHLTDDNRPAADFPVNDFWGRGVLLDVRGEKSIGMKPVYEEMIREQDVILLLTDCDKGYFNDAYFSQHPVVSHDLAEFLLSRKIKILGMDMPAPDYPPFTFHKALLENGIFVLENLTNLKSLIGVNEFKVMALPLKINAEASFVRAVCIVEDIR